MALKMLMLDKKLREKRSALEELERIDFATREVELGKAIEEAETQEQRETVEDAVNTFESERKENADARAALEEEISDIEAEIANLERDDSAKEKESDEKKEESRGMERESAD